MYCGSCCTNNKVLDPDGTDHGTIIRTEVTRKKILCYMRDSACGWYIVKKAKIFQSYVKYFLILAGVKKCRNLIGLCK